MKGVNNTIPKKHKVMLSNYVSDREDLEYLEKQEKEYNENLQRFNVAYEHYKKTGEIEPELAEAMFASYKQSLEPITLRCFGNQKKGLSEKCALQEKNLKELGYDTELIYQLNKM